MPIIMTDLPSRKYLCDDFNLIEHHDPGQPCIVCQNVCDEHNIQLCCKCCDERDECDMYDSCRMVDRNKCRYEESRIEVIIGG